MNNKQNLKKQYYILPENEQKLEQMSVANTMNKSAIINYLISKQKKIKLF